jgi:hypothetical protein
MSRTEAKASSRTLRKASNKLAKKIGTVVRHTRTPSADFDRLVTKVRDPRKLAEHYYRLGLRRGLIRATDYVAEGKFKLGKDGSLLASDSVTISVRLGLPGLPTQDRQFKFASSDLGFS